MLDDVDLLVCGAGPVGCVVAERAATLLGWTVLVVDRRPHVAGNCFDSVHRNGVLVHNYGPHYFRTNDVGVLRYLSRFTEWIPARYEVRSSVRGQLYPFPINLSTLEQFYGVPLDPESGNRLLEQTRAKFSTPRNSEELVLSRVGRELYEAFYLNYTLKQWGAHPRDLSPQVCGRVPVRLNRDERYVDQRYQVMPRRGFTALFAKMLRHRKIRVLLDCPFHEIRDLVRPRRATVYSGPIDDYFGHKLGKLPYRSLKFEFVTHRAEYVQPCVQINYPNDHAYTRSVEIKHVTRQRHAETVVSYETPTAAGEPYYPIPRPDNSALYQRYRQLADEERVRRRVYFCGRLAQYRYFNTDEVVREALTCFQQIRQDCAAECDPLCYVVADLRGLTEPGDPPVADLCARGVDVHVLWCGDPALATAVGPLNALRSAGARIHQLDQSLSPAAFRVRNLYEPSPADHADHVRHGLTELHREFLFDRIEFGVRAGLGFRSLQAKRAELAFHDVTLAVRFDECNQLIREGAQRWTSDLGELELDYIERSSFEMADAVVFPTPQSETTLRELGWTISPVRIGPAERSSNHHGATCTETPLVTIGIAHYNLGRFLPAALRSLAAQTYSNLDVLVIDDGSTDRPSIDAVAHAEKQYPGYRFLRQANAGIGATRNRCLAEARGEFFIPMDADNLARPDMVERFVAGIRSNHHLSAMTCYHLAFTGDAETPPDEFLYAGRPTGGPHTMASIRNVYGDANAIFRTAAFRTVGGYETDRGTSCEDWEAFVKLVHAGKQIGVVPDYLFYYRHRDGGFSRVTNWFANHQRVLRQFKKLDHLPAGEAAVLWTALLGFQQRAEQLAEQQQCLRYRIADQLHSVWARMPLGRRGIKQLVRSTWSACRRLAR